MNIKQWLRNWMLSDDRQDVPSPIATKAGSSLNLIEDEASSLTFTIIRAANGRIVKVSKYAPQQRGPDWQHQLYIVKDDEKIPDVIARIMAINALEQ